MSNCDSFDSSNWAGTQGPPGSSGNTTDMTAEQIAYGVSGTVVPASVDNVDDFLAYLETAFLAYLNPTQLSTANPYDILQLSPTSGVWESVNLGMAIQALINGNAGDLVVSNGTTVEAMPFLDALGAALGANPNSLLVTDANGDVIGFTPAAGSIVTTDASGNLTSFTPSASTILTVDATGALVAMPITPGSLFTVDAAGNLVEIPAPGTAADQVLRYDNVNGVWEVQPQTVVIRHESTPGVALALSSGDTVAIVPDLAVPVIDDLPGSIVSGSLVVTPDWEGVWNFDANAAINYEIDTDPTQTDARVETTIFLKKNGATFAYTQLGPVSYTPVDPGAAGSPVIAANFIGAHRGEVSGPIDVVAGDTISIEVTSTPTNHTAYSATLEAATLSGFFLRGV